MKPKALINLPKWTYVVEAAAVFAMAAYFFQLQGYAWADYISPCGTLVEIAIWAAIVLDLKKRDMIGPGLIVVLGLSLLLSLVSDVVSFFSDDFLALGLYMIVWLTAMVMISVSYSGLFKKYAIIDIACFFGVAALSVGMDLFDVGTSGSLFSGIMKYVALPLLYFPYQALVNAINEGVEDDEEGVEVGEGETDTETE